MESFIFDVKRERNNGKLNDRQFSGPSGLDGIPGEKGERGWDGLNGPPGEIGEKGDRGYSGAIGVTGTIGYVGQKGDKGEDCIEPPMGPKGNRGYPGTITNSAFVKIYQSQCNLQNRRMKYALKAPRRKFDSQILTRCTSNLEDSRHSDTFKSRTESEHCGLF